MITALYVSQFIWPMFLLAFITVAMFIALVILNSIRQTVKALVLDIAQVIQTFKSYEQDRLERRQLFEDDRQIARLQIQAGRRLMIDAENYTAVWQGGLRDATTKH